MATLSLLNRVLPRRVGARRFAALVSPHGLHVVEYVRERDGLSLTSGIAQRDVAEDPASLARDVADAVLSLGGRGGHLALALGGFGTAHHILTLPMADDDVLRPIVRRELLRYYPKLDDPVVGFVRGAHAEDSAPPKQEVLVGAAPLRVAEALSKELGDRGVELHHLTVLPAVLQTLYDTFDGGRDAAVMVVLAETGLLIGCFYRGALRLFIEPPQDMHGRPLRSPEAVFEQVERANLFLRQQFPAVGGARVLLAAPQDEVATVASRLEAGLEVKVEPITEGSAGSLAALGAALDAGSETPLQLLPAALRPRTQAERWTRRLAGAAAVVIMAAAAWWAGSATMVARVEADRAASVERQVRAELAWLTGARRTLEARRGHETRLDFLAGEAARSAESRRILAAVADAAPPGVRLDTLNVQRLGEGWVIDLKGRAEGRTSAAAVQAVDALYRGIPERLPTDEVELGELRDVQDGEEDTAVVAGAAPVAIGFDMSFIVQWRTDSTR